MAVLLLASLALVPAAFSQAIIIDHTCTDLGVIPEYWIGQAKALFRMSYGHTSHGSQVVTGMGVLFGLYGSPYAFDHDPSEGVLSLHDGEPSGDLGYPDWTTWAQNTRDLLDTIGNDRNLIMWSWCGQVSGATEENIETYLSLMTQLESSYSTVRFIYMTGHMDGSGSSGNLHLRNQQIRSYCATNGKVLFDFNDIERYDPGGTDYLDLAVDDGCYYWQDEVQRNWAQEWCADHPDDDRCASCGEGGCCAHSQPLNCNMKGRAFWWMMARLAGWNGQTGEVTPTPVPSPTPLHARSGGGDYDGDGTSDTAVFRPATGLWSIRNLTRFYFGGSADLPVPGDFSGNGTAAAAVFRPASGLWSVRSLTRFYMGSSQDWALPGNYGGDGTSHPVIFRSATGLWSIRDLTRIFYGGDSSIPVPADYDGDGTGDIAVFQPSLSRWAVRGLTGFYFGLSGDEAVPFDSEGDGTEEAAVFRPLGGLWASRGVTGIYFGLSGDRPVPGRYGGPAADLPAVFRPATGLWSIRDLTRFFFGSSSDLPASR
jgi:hypothetical protein